MFYPSKAACWDGTFFFFFKRLLKEFDKMPKLGTQKKSKQTNKIQGKAACGKQFPFFSSFFLLRRRRIGRIGARPSKKKTQRPTPKKVEKTKKKPKTKQNKRNPVKLGTGATPRLKIYNKKKRYRSPSFIDAGPSSILRNSTRKSKKKRMENGTKPVDSESSTRLVKKKQKEDSKPLEDVSRS